MKSPEYKRQLLEFILTAYPDGLPEGCSQTIVMTLADGNGNMKRFNFRFDKEDYNDYLSKRKQTNDDDGKSFDRQLTPKDLDFLKQLCITPNDVEK